MGIDITRLHECEQIMLFNKRYRETEFHSYAPNDDKVYILKDGARPWELCFSYLVEENDSEDVDSIEIHFCPYCGEKLLRSNDDLSSSLSG